MQDHERRIYDSMLGLLSSAENPTPLVRLNRVVPFEHTQVYAKLEWYNPFGSVKDRVAANMLADAEERGVIGEHQKLVEPTSGNTGMGLAMMANAGGYSLRTPLSKAIPVEKRTILRFFGSEVIELDDALCPAPGAPEGAIALALETAERPDFHMLNQYENEANPGAHYKTTGPEIWRQTRGEVTHFAAGLGTCGTITGTGRYLKEQNGAVQVLGVHPAEGHDIPGVRSIKQLAMTELYCPDQYDAMVEVSNQSAFDLCLRLNREESIIAGPSSAMALAGALELVPDEPGNVVVVLFPDNVFKYCSSIAKHLPQSAAAAGGGAPTSIHGRLMKQMVDNARVSSKLTVLVEETQRLVDDEATFVLDVRSVDDFAEGRLPTSSNIPLEELGERAAELPEDRNAPIVAVCGRGNISISAVLFLASLDYTNARSMFGGTTAWVEEGYPVETG